MASNNSYLKLGFGYALGFGAFAFSVYAALHAGANPPLQVALCLFGGVLGWVIGILTTPLSPSERKRFSDFAKAVSAVITGFVLAKLDSVFPALLDKAAAAEGETILLRVTLFSTCLLIGFLYTFITRLYWPD
jgi:hypothetical protein